MRRWTAAALVIVAAIGLIPTGVQRASAQPTAPKGGKPTEERFLTADGVELSGLFHAATLTADQKASETPVVVFLYAPGVDRDMTKGDWAGLAKTLTKEGYHVFQFDWRGHGNSKSIKDKQLFWGNQFLNAPLGGFNALITGGPPKQPLKGELDPKDITKPDRFLPAYLDDLAAVRFHLDEKNDNKELNTGSIYIVGEREAASLGMAWLAAEWMRPATAPNVAQLAGNPNYLVVPQPVAGKWAEAGSDYGGAVWLTARRPSSFPREVVQNWVKKTPKIRETNPMLFLVGDKDDKAHGAKNEGMTDSEFFVKNVLVAKGSKELMVDELKYTKLLPVKGANQLQGVKLLGDNATLKTEDLIVGCFNTIQREVRQKVTSKARGYKDPYFIDVREFGLNP